MTNRSKACITALTLFMTATAAAACAGGGASSAPGATTPPVPAAPPPASAPPGPGTGASPAAAPPFAALRDRALGELLEDAPENGRIVGLHEYDAKVPELSRDAIAARVVRARKTRSDLGALDAHALPADDALDLAELRTALDTEIFWLDDMKSAEKRPSFYEPLFAVSAYLDVDYAPLEERARRLVAHEEAALAQLPHVYENLVPPLSKPLTAVATRVYAGYATYLRGEVRTKLRGLGDAAFQARFARANESLAAEAQKLSAFFAKESPRGDDSHVLGAARFERLVRVQEGLDTPLADLVAMNEANLQANKAAYEALAPKVKTTLLRESTALEVARGLVARTRRFVLDKGLVTLASDDPVVVRETPPYARTNGASIETSGPFDTAKSAYFNVTLPEPSMPAAERAEYLGTLGILAATTTHEAFPGHFVQIRWNDRAPTRVQKILVSYSFSEGWAHYSEQLMIDEGFGAEDPQNKLAQLQDALLRNCRFAAAFGMHAGGMSLADAERRFVNDCHQPPPRAREQALRGTFDAWYFAYTLGKLQILALRDEARSRLGPKFSLRRFHDALLAHGTPPVALIRERVLHDLESAP
jgi:hypothetical protein